LFDECVNEKLENAELTTTELINELNLLALSARNKDASAYEVKFDELSNRFSKSQFVDGHGVKMEVLIACVENAENAKDTSTYNGQVTYFLQNELKEAEKKVAKCEPASVLKGLNEIKLKYKAENNESKILTNLIGFAMQFELKHTNKN
jgi:hypothetical protein